MACHRLHIYHALKFLIFLPIYTVMKKNCGGHPTRKAHWHCPKCEALLCPQCVVKRDSESYGIKKTQHFCPKCNLPVDWVGVQNLIEPFWNRMPRIFSYPVSMHPLILIAVLAFVSMLLSGPGIFSAIFKGVTWLIVVKYSFESLKATAGGNLKPPPISSKTISEDFFRVFKQFGIYLAIFIAFGWIGAKYQTKSFRSSWTTEVTGARSFGKNHLWKTTQVPHFRLTRQLPVFMIKPAPRGRKVGAMANIQTAKRRTPSPV